MSTQQPTTDRIASNQPEPTLTDGRWRADDAPASATALRNAQLQFLPDGYRRLHNLFDTANQAMPEARDD